jgi:hypothetical protein
LTKRLHFALIKEQFQSPIQSKIQSSDELKALMKQYERFFNEDIRGQILPKQHRDPKRRWSSE